MEPVEIQPSNNKKPGGCTGRGFLPGVSGNPKGRPKGKTLLGAIRDELAKRSAKIPGGLKMEEAAAAYVDAMLKGSFNHSKEVIEREDGSVPEDVLIEVRYVDAVAARESTN